jgi:hypothetical protein
MYNLYFYFQTYIDMEFEESVNTSKDSSTLNITSIISNLVGQIISLLDVSFLYVYCNQWPFCGPKIVQPGHIIYYLVGAHVAQ